MGIDASEKMISKAIIRAKKQNVNNLVEFRVADLYSLPFNDSSFDVALFESVINVLAGDRQRAMNEIARVVRSNGIVAGNEVIVFQETPLELYDLFSKEASFLGKPITTTDLTSLFHNASLKVFKVQEHPSSEISRLMIWKDVMKLLGIGGLTSYLCKMIYYSLRYPVLRQYTKYSRSVLRNKNTRKFFGYVFIVSQKIN